MKKIYRCWAEIDLDALRGNLAWIRHRAGKETKVITVVKADAYGHGLRQIAALLMQSGTDVFGVANLAEATAIRSVGKGWPILMLGACLPEEVEMAVRDDVMPTISSLAEAKLFSSAAARFGKTVNVHMKVDTGMGRLGVATSEAASLIDSIAGLAGLKLSGLYTHYASAEDDARFSRKQCERFQQVIGPILKQHAVEYVHANNSAAVLFEPCDLFNTVRPGLLVYGVIPSGKRRLPSGLLEHIQPALRWKCRVSFIKEVPEGTALGYGQGFITRKKSTRVATITAGYGDGYLRSGSNRAKVLVQGKRCPILGRISMDQMLVDVSSIGNVGIGDEVTLIGAQGNDVIGVSEVAAWCGTIPWEVLTNITYRVPRVYQGQQAA
jgi:alanine racemase